MDTFSTFFTEREVVGLVEELHLDDVGPVTARIDSGNTGYNVLHATNITVLQENKVQFTTVNGIKLVKPIVAFVDVQMGGDISEKRVVVEFNTRFRSAFYQKIKYSLTDRSNNKEKALVGLVFLRQLEALIDVNQRQLIEYQQWIRKLNLAE